MAWALMSRAMLYAGRWQKVVDAAAEVEALGYGLEDSYSDAWGKSIADGNNEAILQYVFDRANDVTHSFDFYYTPGGDYYFFGETGGGYAYPTQEMVESYEYAGGGQVTGALGIRMPFPRSLRTTSLNRALPQPYSTTARPGRAAP